MSTKSHNIITLVCILIIMFCIVAFVLIAVDNRDKTNFVFNEHLQDTLVTISYDDNVDSLSLKDVSYYILVMEASVNHTASLYNPSNNSAYWNLYINNTFLKSIAKDNTIYVAIRDHIYYCEALANGYKLDESEQKIISEEADSIYNNMTGKQVDATALTLEDLYNIRYKIGLATKYITHLKNDEGLTEEELNIDGKFYTELLEKYVYKIDNLCDNITLGNITVDDTNITQQEN